MITKTHYIASARCHEVKYCDGRIATREDTEVWMGETDGYASCEANKSRAKAFRRIPKLQTLRGWDGMPWYYRLKPDTFKITKVTTVTQEPVVTEEDVTRDALGEDE